MKMARTPTNTQRLSSTGVPRGTTTVSTADSSVTTTIDAPASRHTTASTVISRSTSPPFHWRARGGSPARPPCPVQGAHRLVEPVARDPHAVAPQAGHVHQPVEEPAPRLRPARVRLPARGDARLGQHLLDPGGKLGRVEVPEPPPRRARRELGLLGRHSRPSPSTLPCLASA